MVFSSVLKTFYPIQICSRESLRFIIPLRKVVTFEVTSLIATSDWNEIRLALASSEKQGCFCHFVQNLFLSIQSQSQQRIKSKKNRQTFDMAISHVSNYTTNRGDTKPGLGHGPGHGPPYGLPYGPPYGPPKILQFLQK